MKILKMLIINFVGFLLLKKILIYYLRTEIIFIFLFLSIIKHKFIKYRYREIKKKFFIFLLYFNIYRIF
jgi:hypothetical protein